MATQTEPQSCYPDEIETLAHMRQEERVRLAAAEVGISEGRALAACLWNKAQAERRIDALETAIEALAGAL